MTATYEKIATTTLGSTQTSTTFSSIASTYTDIVIVVNELYEFNTINVFIVCIEFNKVNSLNACE